MAQKFMVFGLWFIVFILFTIYYLPYTSPVLAQCDPNIPGDCPAGLNEIEAVFKTVISVIVGLAFMALLVLLILAGIRYLTSGGEPKAIQSAHQTVTWALLGIVFLAVAWIILQLIKAFTGIEVTVFDIRTLCEVGGRNWCQP